MGYRALLCLLVLFSSCYSFRGVTIAPTIETFYVEQFQNPAFNAPPDLGIRFSNDLRQRIINNSRLSNSENGPDIEFSGSIQTFSVTSVAPSNDGETVGSALNRLSIGVKVTYTDSQDDEKSWESSFSFFQDFGSDQQLSDVQDGLIDVIFEKITQDIFNRAFTNW